MLRWMALGWLLLAATPLWAQLYSYRGPDGRLVITDRPVKEKGYKLKDTFIPKRLRKVPNYNNRPRGEGIFLTDNQLDGLVLPIAKSMGVDPELVKAVIEIESARNVRAKSSKGAMGLMQLIPDTAKRFGVDNPWDPRQNVRGGVMYLRYLLSYFEGDVDLVLAAYNAGENAVDRFNGIPPYKETRHYVKKIRRHYQEVSHTFDNTAKRRSKLVAKRKRLAKEKAKELASAS